MITSWQIYWITRMDSIIILCIWCMIGGIITSVIFFIASAINADENRTTLSDYLKSNVLMKRLIIIPAVSACIAGIIASFVPSTKEFAAIYLIPKIAANEQIQKVPGNALKLLNAKLEGWIDDQLKDKKKEK